MTKNYRSDLMASLHESAEDLYAAGIIDKKTMREFDEACLTKAVPLAPAEIAALRQREEVSQAVFARHLNVPVSLVSQWERGERKPTGAAVKLLALVKAKGLATIA
jgi:putative transcriptional regulator